MICLKGRLPFCLKLSVASIAYNGHFYTLKFLTSTKVLLLGDEHRIARFCFFFFKKRFYLVTHERHRDEGRNIDRGRSRLHEGSPTWDLTPGLQVHALS